MPNTETEQSDYSQSQPPDTDWVTITEAAQILGVSPDSLRRWDVPGGKLRAHRTPGGQRRYRRSELANAFRRTA